MFEVEQDKKRNGQAIDSPYEVRDRETGEVVPGAFALVPSEDDFAFTVLLAYLRLCGMSATQNEISETNKLVKGGPSNALTEKMKDAVPYDDSCSTGGAVPIFSWAYQSTERDFGPFGTVEHLEKVASYSRLNPVCLIFGKHRLDDV